jgi:transposase-like protein
MKGTRHSEEQIIAILKQGEAGLTTAELCRQHGITEQTYYRWNQIEVRVQQLVARQHERLVFVVLVRVDDGKHENDAGMQALVLP